jgi:hypothetical protein
MLPNIEKNDADDYADRDEKPRYLSPGAYIIGVIVFRLLNSLHWALVGGLGWGLGTAVGSMLQFPGAATLGGAAGLALVIFSVLTVGLGERTELIPAAVAGFGGVAAGSVSLSLLIPPGTAVHLAVGGLAGFFVGMCSSVMKQQFAPVGIGPASVIAITGAVLFAGIGLLLGGWIGWAAAGGISLFWIAVLAECMRRQPAVLVDGDGQPIREIPRRETCWRVVRQSWSPTDPLAWGWHGVIGGILASFWVSWATEHPDTSLVRNAFLICGGAAAVVIVAIRLGLKLPEQSQPTSNAP